MIEISDFKYPTFVVSGAGNRFVIFDCTAQALKDGLTNGHQLAVSELVKGICRSMAMKVRTNVDGVVYLFQGESPDVFAWDFYNSDGSSAEMCGNAARCVGAVVYHQKQIPQFQLQTRSGLVAIQRLNNKNFQVEMKISQISKLTSQTWLVNSGVPHIVVVEKDYQSAKVVQSERWNPAAGEKGANVTFVKGASDEGVEGKHEKDNKKLVSSILFEAVTFERGVEGYTPACGTGAVAAASVLRELGFVTTEAKIKMPGGLLTVIFDIKISYLNGDAIIEESFFLQ